MFVLGKYEGQCKGEKIDWKSRGKEKNMKENKIGVEFYILILFVTSNLFYFIYFN